jgi:nucleoside-diphosphate-sugar epimerase
MITRLLEGQAPEIYGEGASRRDYIYVDDLCQATLKASLNEAAGVFNIGTGIGTSSAELAQLLVRLTGATVEPVRVHRDLDAQATSSLIYEIGKMRRELGFVPAVTLEEGLARTIAYLRSAREGREHERQTQPAGAGRGSG